MMMIKWWNEVNEPYRTQKIDFLCAYSRNLNKLKKHHKNLFDEDMETIGILYNSMPKEEMEELWKEKVFIDNYLNNIDNENI